MAQTVKVHEVTQEEMNTGYFAFDGFVIDRHTTREALIEANEQGILPGEWDEEEEEYGVFKPAELLSSNGIRVRAFITVDHHGLEDISLLPIREFGSPNLQENEELEENFRKSRLFLAPFLGDALDKRFLWGKVETYLVPDDFGGYHGGDVYLYFN